ATATDARLYVRRRSRLLDGGALRGRGALGTQTAMSAPPPVGLSVVMPLHNEGARIASNVEQTMAVLRMLGPFEMILVDDGSLDNSGEEMTRLAEKFPGEIV